MKKLRLSSVFILVIIASFSSAIRSMAGPAQEQLTSDLSSFSIYDRRDTTVLLDEYKNTLNSLTWMTLFAFGLRQPSLPQPRTLLEQLLAEDPLKQVKETYRKEIAQETIEKIQDILQQYFILEKLPLLMLSTMADHQLYPQEADAEYCRSVFDTNKLHFFLSLTSKKEFGPLHDQTLYMPYVACCHRLKNGLSEISADQFSDAIKILQEKIGEHVNEIKQQCIVLTLDAISGIRHSEKALSKQFIPQPSKCYFSPGIIPILVKLVSDEQEGISAAYYQFTHRHLAQAFIDKSKELKGSGGNPSPVQLIVDKQFDRNNCQALSMLLANKIPVRCNGGRKRFATGRAEYENMHHKFMILHCNKDGHPLLVTGSFNPTGQANTNSSENIVIIGDPEDIAKHQQEFGELLQHANPVTLADCQRGKRYTNPYTARINGF